MCNFIKKGEVKSPQHLKRGMNHNSLKKESNFGPKLTVTVKFYEFLNFNSMKLSSFKFKEVILSLKLKKLVK